MNAPRDAVVGAAARGLVEAWRAWVAVHEPSDAERELARVLTVNALGGFAAEPTGRKHPLDMTRTELQQIQLNGACARRIIEAFPAWSAHPSWPLSNWLKTAPDATVVRVRSELREMGVEDV